MDNPVQTQPPLPPVHEAALEKLRMIAGEYFDDWLIVVSKNGNNGTQRWRAYKTEDGAHGKASFILHEINKRWWSEGGKDVK